MHDNSTISVVGINHKCSDVSVREKFQIHRKDLAQCLKFIFNQQQIQAVIIISTCNRLEFYFIAPANFHPNDIIAGMYSEILNINNTLPTFYHLENEKAVNHLFKVACGLDSMIFGEYQIIGQIKEAYSVACKHQTVDKILHKLFHAAFRTSKKVRSQTSIGQGKQSVSGAAAKIIIDNTSTQDYITIISVNENTKIMAQQLIDSGRHNLIFLNRTKYKAEIMAEQFGGTAHSLNSLEKSMFQSKAIFSCSGAPDFIIKKEMIERLIVQNRCPELFVDMAVPRDIQSDFSSSAFKSYNISDLSDFLMYQKENQAKDLPTAMHIIQNETDLFHAWSASSKNDIIQPYAEQFELVRQQVIDEFAPQFSEKSLEQVEKLSKSMLHRLQSTFVRAIIKEKK